MNKKSSTTRVKTRKNFRDMKQYKQQVTPSKKGKGSYKRLNDDVWRSK